MIYNAKPYYLGIMIVRQKCNLRVDLEQPSPYNKLATLGCLFYNIKMVCEMIYDKEAFQKRIWTVKCYSSQIFNIV